MTEISFIPAEENTITFNLELEGTKPDNIEVRFCVKLTKYTLIFNAEKLDDKWVVKIPATNLLKKNEYPYNIEVIANNYHFIPLKGTLKSSTVEEPKISVEKKQEKTKQETPSKSPDEDKKDTTKEPTKVSENKNPIIKSFYGLSESDIKVKNALRKLSI